MQNGWGVRRINAWLLVPAVLLALSLGTLLGRAVDDNSTTASGPKTEVLGSVVTRPDSAETTTTAEPETTTTAAPEPAPAAAATTTTTAKAAAVVATTTPTTARPATTTTTRRPVDDGCGTGEASASGKFRITGDGPPSDPVFTYSGPVTVTNSTSKPIQIDSLEVRITSNDGTVERVQVAGAQGSIVEAGASRDYAFSHTTKHEPKDGGGGTQLGTFSYRAPGGSALCGTT